MLRDVLTDPDTRPVPVILLTGRWKPTLADAAREAGFAAALMKPCSPAKLNQVITIVYQAVVFG